MKKIAGIIILFFFMAETGLFSQKKDYTSEKIERYKKEAVVQPAFVPLEVGEIRPEGWLLDWAETAARGITGHLDEYENVFKYGWKGIAFQARGANPDGTGWPLEQCSYWLDGAVKLGYILDDTTLIRKTSERLNLVVNGVLDGGKTFVYWKPKSIVNDYFNNWAHALMGRCLVSYYQATHDPRILQALEKVYSGFSIWMPTEKDARTIQGSMDHMRGTTNIDAMTETYLMTGNKSVLDSLVAFGKGSELKHIEQTWLNTNSSKEVDESESIHGVSFYETMRVPAIESLWTGDKKAIEASEHILKWAEKKNLLPYGVCSSEEYLAGRGSFRNTETCNVPTSMWSLSWLLRLSGDGRWGDKIERVFFNAGPASVARDYKTMCYYQSPNRFGNAMPSEPPIPGKGDLSFTKYGDEVLCCVGNVNNEIPDYIQNICMATMDGGLAFTLYGPCEISKKTGDENLKVSCETSYPFNDKIRIRMLSPLAVKMPVYLRIPSWCSAPSVVLNGKKIGLNRRNGFVEIDRVWKKGDKIDLVFPMEAKVAQSSETPYPKVNYFKGTKAAGDRGVNNPFACVTYGPLLYALPIKDLDPNHEEAGSKYGYALDVAPGKEKQGIKVIRKSMKKNWNWGLYDSPVQLRVKAKSFDWIPDELQALPKEALKTGEPTTIDLVPYGCTKFRVSMFPVTEESWRENHSFNKKGTVH